MTRYKLSNDAKMDLARIYWHGKEEFGEYQAIRYYEALILRFDEIAIEGVFAAQRVLLPCY